MFEVLTKKNPPLDIFKIREIEDLSPDDLSSQEWLALAKLLARTAIHWREEAMRWQTETHLWEKVATNEKRNVLRERLGLPERKGGRPKKESPVGIGLLTTEYMLRLQLKQAKYTITDERARRLIAETDAKARELSRSLERHVGDKGALDWIMEHQCGVTSPTERARELKYWCRFVSRHRKRLERLDSMSSHEGQKT